jgi:hypothetical protein
MSLTLPSAGCDSFRPLLRPTATLRFARLGEQMARAGENALIASIDIRPWYKRNASLAERTPRMACTRLLWVHGRRGLCGLTPGFAVPFCSCFVWVKPRYAVSTHVARIRPLRSTTSGSMQHCASWRITLRGRPLLLSVNITRTSVFVNRCGALRHAELTTARIKIVWTRSNSLSRVAMDCGNENTIRTVGS